ncbi:MAG: dihydropteroate synthase [Elusimicrobiota bacterium]|jgi:dihydropteroate synthase|nr:dihydropteroate synthase [Elusimicrobiota bacterium]
MKQFPLIMGILNTTPDSFFDGGKYAAIEAAIRRAEDILSQGGDIIDIGGQSTRPGSGDVEIKTEIQRTLPVILEIKRLWPNTEISIDTFNYETAKEALSAGATIINDVSGLKDTRLATLAADYDAKLVIMHARSKPADMQNFCDYDDILADIHKFFEEKIEIAKQLGVKNIILDPGLGFAKTRKQNWQLLDNLDCFKNLNLPFLIGASRKSFTDKTLEKSLEAVKKAYQANAAILRVHDVKETKQFLENLRD